MDPLQRSLTSLELTDILLGAPPPGSSSTFYPPPQQQLVAAGAGFDWLEQPAGSSSFFLGPGQGLGQQHAWKGLSVHIGDTLSRVTQFAKDKTSSIFAAMENWHPQAGEEGEEEGDEVGAAGAAGMQRLSLGSGEQQQQPGWQHVGSSSSGAGPRAEPIAIPGPAGPARPLGLGEERSSSKRQRSCEGELRAHALPCPCSPLCVLHPPMVHCEHFPLLRMQWYRTL